MKKRMTLLLTLLSLCCCILCSAVGVAETLHPALLTISSGQSIGNGAYINHNHSGYPFIAEIQLDEMTMPMQSCTLGVYSWDCDEDASSYASTDEYDMVFVNDTCVGVLTGVDQSWKTSYFSVPLEALRLGTNRITIYVGHRDRATGQVVQNTNHWLLEVKWLSLQMDGGQAAEAPERFEITLATADRTATGISCTANVTIQSNKQRSYVVEYSLVDRTGSGAANGQIIAGDEERVSGTNIVSTGRFYLPSGAPMGSYEIQATLRDPATNEILAYTSKTYNLQTLLTGSCDHVGSGQREFDATEYYRLGASDPDDNLMHRAIDIYRDVCTKCGQVFYDFQNSRKEEHASLPYCTACGYTDENYNSIHSAEFMPMYDGYAGEPFILKVVTDRMVKSVTAVNSTGNPIVGDWQRTENEDGTLTWEKVFNATKTNPDQYWVVSAHSRRHGEGELLGTMETNHCAVRAEGEPAIPVKEEFEKLPDPDVTLEIFSSGITASWDEVEGAERYIYSLYNITDDQRIANHVAVDGCTLRLDLDAGKKYRVAVAAVPAVVKDTVAEADKCSWWQTEFEVPMYIQGFTMSSDSVKIGEEVTFTLDLVNVADGDTLEVEFCADEWTETFDLTVPANTFRRAFSQAGQRSIKFRARSEDGEWSNYCEAKTLNVKKNEVLLKDVLDKLEGKFEFSEDYKQEEYYEKLLNVKLTGNVREDIVAIAKSQVGYKETGNNNTEYGKWIGHNNDQWCATFASWCIYLGAYVNDMDPKNIVQKSEGASFKSEKFDLSGTKGAYDPPQTFTFKQIKDGYQYKDELIVVQPGDLVFVAWLDKPGVKRRDQFDEDGELPYHDGKMTVNISHVEIVESFVPNGDGTYTITTIGGNTDGGTKTYRRVNKANSYGKTEDMYILYFGKPKYD